MCDIKRILCPVDFSEASTHAVEQAIALATWTRARITALHVCAPVFMPVPGLPEPDDRVSAAEIRFTHDRLAACFRDAAGPVDVLVEVGRPADHILDCSVGLPADVIVMGTHGASGFEHLLLGSVTEKVLRKARCAVLTVPPLARGALNVAAAGRSDLVVMGVHGRNAIDVMLFGSTTNQVVRRATCPVLTLRQ